MAGARAIGRAASEILTLFVALGVAPLSPVLAATCVGLPWQAIVLAGVWAAC